ncbi:MAG: DNA repair protein RadA [Candidatus Aquicultor sp.]|nr:DNA repair protein RadA [Candidatus Aquicultor sp.]
MSKIKYLVRCQACGCTAPKWMGRCPDCGEWNTMVEEPIESGISRSEAGLAPAEAPQPVTSIVSDAEARVPTGMSEFDRVLGGGVVPGSLVLIGGEPGIGKSTLLLQVAHSLGERLGTVLIASGEESPRQISLRAKRLGALSEKLLLLSETDVTVLERQIRHTEPALLIVDSIQTMFHPDLPSAPGSVGQVRECTHYLMRIAKQTHLPIFITGHVTKEGSIAGPRVLEHMVDTVLYFEGDNYHSFRIVRAVKNRFGSTNEIGIFEMTDAGLMEVANPSAQFLSQRPDCPSGSIVVATVEGTRPLLVELQALVSSSYLTMPRRMATGYDHNRLSLIVAVLDRRVGLHLGQEDIYLNVAGGIKISEPAADLAVAIAIASSHKDIPIDKELVAIGEVGLTGEVRYVSQLEARLKEASKLGFKRAIVPDQDVRSKSGFGIELLKAKSVRSALDSVE